MAFIKGHDPTFNLDRHWEYPCLVPQRSCFSLSRLSDSSLHTVRLALKQLQDWCVRQAFLCTTDVTYLQVCLVVIITITLLLPTPYHQLQLYNNVDEQMCASPMHFLFLSIVLCFFLHLWLYTHIHINYTQQGLQAHRDITDNQPDNHS